MEQQGSGNDAISRKDGPHHYNHLAGQKSQYLSQHAENPVDWYPWGEEAFCRAAAENKPVFLSIGYASCHWCHVMAHESFENGHVARLLNEAFVCVKVDREERPDIDQIYMAACRMMSGTGGWPLTLFLTPDRKPFFAATYLPRESRFKITGLVDLLPRIATLWKERRDDLLNSSDQIHAALKDLIRQDRSGDAPGSELLDAAYGELVLAFDAEYGGFGRAPKFPLPHNLMFLLRYWKRTGTAYALDMVKQTLDGIRNGGIYDQIGGGVHRYSTDREWRIPHFEKMLYDQALLAQAYTEIFLATGTPCYQRTAEEILGYVLREMTSLDGTFFSAEDADTGGREGGYYLWDSSELHHVLGTEDAAIAEVVFNATSTGNFTDPHGAGSGNVLYRADPADIPPGRFSLTAGELATRIETITKSLFAAREQRPRPLRNEMVLADVNGLMIAALAKASRAFDNPAYAAAAAKAADGILSQMRAPDGGLFHRYHSGEAAVSGFADDYANMAYGLIELYEATFDERALAAAIDLASFLMAHFQDADQGGFFTTPDDGEQLLIRSKEIYDGAVPSANSVIFFILLRLFRLTGDAVYHATAAKFPAAFSRALRSTPSAHTFFLCALDYATGKPAEVVISGNLTRVDARDMIHVVATGFYPSVTLTFRKEGFLPEKTPLPGLYLGSYTAISGRATAYVCTGSACSVPVTDPDALKKLLNDAG